MLSLMLPTKTDALVGHSMRLEWDKNKAVLKWDKHLTCQGDVSVPLVTSQGVEQSNAVKADVFRAFWASEGGISLLKTRQLF